MDVIVHCALEKILMNLEIWNKLQGIFYDQMVSKKFNINLKMSLLATLLHSH